MTHLIKNKLEFLKACFPTMVSKAYTNVNGEFVEFVKIDSESSINLVLLGQFIKTLRVGGMSDYFDKFIIDYINNDSDLLYRENVLKSKRKKTLLIEKSIIHKGFGIIDIVREAF
tara:strand:+ start:438 stop:782 length:345 start_codon:yes stop_codon:yes gene_type:complete